MLKPNKTIQMFYSFLPLSKTKQFRILLPNSIYKLLMVIFVVVGLYIVLYINFDSLSH